MNHKIAQNIPKEVKKPRILLCCGNGVAAAWAGVHSLRKKSHTTSRNTVTVSRSRLLMLHIFLFVNKGSHKPQVSGGAIFVAIALPHMRM
mmetsp:Transcript_8847/g.32667  ORF Transcript_8847/g.32667 Transcript_8847/m.32667 type:complete len:90 (-) Transcript_8847:264-533(-)